MELDRIDRHILDLLQTDNQISNVALAEKVGLSPPACSRRVARLRSQGPIVRDVAVLDPRLVGKTLTAIVTVTLEVRRRQALEEFEGKMRRRDEVLRCYMVSGAVDYVLVVVADDMDGYARFASEQLSADELVKGFESWIVLNRIKDESKITLFP
jgi:Lrp/AsnC family transcriptional regulator, leucine-responsive regulatory protein